MGLGYMGVGLKVEPGRGAGTSRDAARQQNDYNGMRFIFREPPVRRSLGEPSVTRGDGCLFTLPASPASRRRCDQGRRLRTVCRPRFSETIPKLDWSK